MNETTLNIAAIESWFAGKTLENAKAALALLLQSEAQGFWVKGASRKVRAALGKSRRAAKMTKSLDWERQFSINTPVTNKIKTALYRAMYFGILEALLGPTYQEVLQTINDPDLMDFYQTFWFVARLIQNLDETRPPPMITHLGVSPTVTKTLEDLRAVRVDVCPIKWIRVARKKTTKEIVYSYDDKDVYFSFEAILEWPPGIIHGSSRFDCSNAGNNQCQACGHAIRNPFNWVPLVLTTKDGALKSLWVGKDCAQSLFGIKMTGELELSQKKP